MPHRKEDYRWTWLIIFVSAPILITTLLWFLMRHSKPGDFFVRFNASNTTVYQGYPLVANTKQSNHLRNTKHKAAMRQPFYLEPIKHDRKKVLALVAFLSNSSNHDPDRAENKCVFHADLLLEIGGFPFGSQAIVCTSCGDVWIGSTASYDDAIAIKPEKIFELKRLVFDILVNPAEWPPEFQD